MEDPTITTDGPNPQPQFPRISFDPLTIPQSLSSTPHWVCWRWARAEKGDGLTKQPVNPHTGDLASSTDPSTWSDFQRATEFACQGNGRRGIGFVVIKDGGIVGIDIDECGDGQGSWSPEAMAIVHEFNSFTEITPSGRGLRIYIVGQKPKGSRCAFSNVPGVKKVEIYDQARYFTVTGQQVPDTPETIEPRQEQLDALITRLTPPANAKPTSAQSRTSESDVSLAPTPDDGVLLERARRAANGEKFAALYDRGDTSLHKGDDSSADMALCCMLAFWTRGDADRIDRLFRASALMRDKWDERRGERTYGEMTVQRAVAITTWNEADAGSSPTTGGESLPEVLMAPDEHRVVDEVIEALASEPSLYQRGGMLVRVMPIDGGGMRIDPLPGPALRGMITRRVSLVTEGKEGTTPAHPREWLVNQVYSRGVWQGIRELEGIRNGPVLRPDGTIFAEAGYDRATGILYRASGLEFSIPANPSRRDAEQAVAVLLEVFADFPFASEQHRAAALAMVLTPLARTAYIGPSPLFLIDSNVRGSGKTLMARAAALIATGEEIAVSSYTGEEEFRKFVTSTLMSGEPMVLLDNLNGMIGSPTLDRLMTAVRWRDRLLGTNGMADVAAKAVWMASGNNVLMMADTSRRIIHVRLRSPLERPENREGFQHPDLIGWVREHRAVLYSAGMVVLSASIRSGEQPSSMRPFGSYESWSSIVRNAVRWVGLPDPLGDENDVPMLTDPSSESLARLLEGLEQVQSSKGLLARDVVELLAAQGAQTKQSHRSIQDALADLSPSGSGKALTAVEIGTIFRTQIERIVNGRWLARMPQKSPDGVRWKVMNRQAEARDDGHDGDDGTSGPFRIRHTGPQGEVDAKSESQGNPNTDGVPPIGEIESS